MVIVCPECSTKFRVNSERIPDSGAKVRCARCKHIFTAHKPQPEEPVVQPAPEPEIALEVPPVPSPAENELLFDEANTTAGEQTEEVFEDSESEEDGFSYDQFRDLDSAQPDDEDFAFDGDDEFAPPAAEDAGTEPEESIFTEETEDESFSFSGPDDDFSAEEDSIEATQKSEEELFAAASDKSSAVRKPTPEEKIASIFADDDEEESAQPTEPELAKPAAQKSSPSSSIIRVLLLLILGLAIIGGALYYINGPQQIEQVIQQILGQHLSPAESGQIALENLEGTFINNLEAGELFVIRGEATNKFKTPRAAIQVKGVIFDQNGKPLLQKTIFCGNPINDQELQTLPFSKLEEMMRNQFGKSLINMKVNSQETIPFVIAFRDLPKNLSEFSVDVTSSEPAAQ